jgi:hypothetical protein
MSAFLSPLRVEEVDEFAGLWKLTAPLRYASDLLGRDVEVPEGFVSDFASIPRLPFVYWAEGGRGDKSAVLHDFAYTSQFVDRATADKLLREALLASGYGEGVAGTFYAAVRLFGSSHWKAPNVPQTAPVDAAMQAAAIEQPLG